jgi:hypothetical protein
VNARERKTIAASLKSANDQGEFVARIARLNAIDKDNDVALPGAFGSSQVAPLLVAHQWGTVPLGKTWIKERGDEVLAEGKINRGLEQGRALYDAMKFDLAHPPSEFEFSYGFQVLDAEPGTFQGQRVRFLKSVRVLEVSTVIAGAGDTALLGVKHADRVASLVREFERLRTLTFDAPPDAAKAKQVARLKAYVESLSPAEQQKWWEQARALQSHANTLLLKLRMDDLTDGLTPYLYTSPHWQDDNGRTELVKGLFRKSGG